MKAAICTRYGPPEVLEIRDVEKPVPKDNEVLIEVHAATAHIGDAKIRSLRPGMGPGRDFLYRPFMRIVLGFRGPRNKILEMEVAGEIVSAGKDVRRFKVGDRVFATTYQGYSFGGYAEYKCMREDRLIALKPSNMTYAEAAPVSNGGLTALLNLRKANLRKGQSILIYGASGSVGTYAVQLAKNHFGAEVTGVCSGANLELVKSLGADRVIDYTKEDFTRDGREYDVVFDAVGKIPPSRRKTSLKRGGAFLDVLSSPEILKLEDLLFLKRLIEEGKVRSVIDRTYPLEEIVEAHRYVDKGHKKGNVIIAVRHDDKS